MAEFDVGDAAGPVFFATAEDMILQKLAWYRGGGECWARLVVRIDGTVESTVGPA